MLKFARTRLLGRARVIAALRTALALAALPTIAASACAATVCQAAVADWRFGASPLLAQQAAADAPSLPIIDWLIVGVLMAAAIFVVCRSSRRN